MAEKQTKIFYPASLAAWRRWLERNHAAQTSVWLVFYSKSSGRKTISWSEAVDVALCYGWIDSKKVKVDAETSHQFFSRRKPRSTWSKINKDKVEKLIAAGLMTEAGLRAVEVAKQNGTWTMLDEVEQLILPRDLEDAFAERPGSAEFFLGLSRSVRKVLLQWLVLARRPETRQKRINEIAEAAAQGKKPPPF